MGGCCCSTAADDEKDNGFKKGGDNDLSEGPVKNRGCTDIFCLPVLALAQVVFLVVTVMGCADGNPDKLYKPRDFSGAYCAVEENWNKGPNTKDHPSLSFTMNVTSVVDTVMKQTICSTMAKTQLVDNALLNTTALQEEYLCTCCLIPCGRCDGSLDKGVDLATAADIDDVIVAKMAELTDPNKGKELLSPSGQNAEAFSTNAFWEQATKYFNPVCLKSCDVDYRNIVDDTARTHVYTPYPDSEYFYYWNLVATQTGSSAIKTAIDGSFTFKALPKSECPYDDASYCIPFPGMQYKGLLGAEDYCAFKVAAEVVEAIDDAAANAFESMGGSAFAETASESFGKWAGDFQRTLDTFIVVSVLSFVVGVVFLVVLRFTVGICVWLAVFSTLLWFVLGGAFLFIMSGQCQGVGLLETGQQFAVAATLTGYHAVNNAVQQKTAPSEKLGPDGTDYVGHQSHTKTGLTCMKWSTQTVMPDFQTVGNHHYCRNEVDPARTYNAKTIWCVTSDSETMWQECLPIGVIRPVCEQGYTVEGKTSRDALYYSSFVVWGLGVVWLVLIICFVNRIRLAIALNKVAAVFLAQNPHILVVPIVQVVTGIVWTILWFYSASFLLSQVPADYTPTGHFKTYAEAFGTSSSCAFWETGEGCDGVPGKCNDKWPTGSVWKDMECEGTGAEAACWRCSPPRYVFDIRFAISFFVFLWNNAFNVALGQIIIAMAVGVWFFSSEKGKAPTLRQAVKTVFRYHLGSVALGSFIVAVVEFIRYLMKYFEKQAQAQKNRFMVIVLKCVQCCIWCFEKCIKFLNKNAYIQIALLGQNFCTSAKKAFFLILRNALRFGTIAALSGIIHMIGFVCIMSGTCVVGYLLVREMHPEVSPFLPILCYVFVSWIVAKLYMNVFGMAVDTSLQCFLVCEEMGLSGEFVPSALSSFIANRKGKSLEDPPDEAANE